MRVSLQLNNFALPKVPAYSIANENLVENNHSKNNSSNSINLNKSPNNIAFMATSPVMLTPKAITGEAFAMRYALGVLTEITKTPNNGALFIKTKKYNEDAYEDNMHNYVRNNLETILKAGIESPHNYPTPMQRIKGLQYFRDNGNDFGKSFYYAFWDVLKEKYHVPDSERKMPEAKVGYFPYEELVMAEEEYGAKRKEGWPEYIEVLDAIDDAKTYTYALWTLGDIMDFYAIDTGVKSNDKGIVDIEGTGQEIVDLWYGDLNLERMLTGCQTKPQANLAHRYNAFVYLKENCGTMGEYIFNGISNALNERYKNTNRQLVYEPVEPEFPINEMAWALKDYKLHVIGSPIELNLGVIDNKVIPKDGDEYQSDYDRNFWQIY